MPWDWKWVRRSILVRGAELERVEVPVYRSTGGPLFKTLLYSGCRMDCRYCPFSRLCRVPRDRWLPEKLVRVFLEAYRQGVVRGLFLSSGLPRDPEEVSEELVAVARKLRRCGYRGYLALRLMPGTPGWLVQEALRVADRVGLNLEAPGEAAFSEIAPSKGSWSLDLYSRLLLAAEYAGHPRRVSTQFVVGAAGETDLELLRVTEALHRAGVGVVHYSAYTPYPGTPLAEKGVPPAPQWRTRLLYQASRLIRDYGYAVREIEPLLNDRGMLSRLGKSLKEALAEAHPEWFPVNPLEAGLRELLRVPGIGHTAARRIIEARREGRLTTLVLQRILGPQRFRRVARFLDLTGLPGPRLPLPSGAASHQAWLDDSSGGGTVSPSSA